MVRAKARLNDTENVGIAEGGATRGVSAHSSWRSRIPRVQYRRLTVEKMGLGRVMERRVKEEKGLDTKETVRITEVAITTTITTDHLVRALGKF